MASHSNPFYKQSISYNNASDGDPKSNDTMNKDQSMVNARASGDIVITISNQTYNTFSPPKMATDANDFQNQMPI